MADRVRELLKKVLEWWNKFTAKQKTLIIAAAAGVIIAVAILVTVLSSPQYVLLLNCDTTKQAAQVTELLDGQSLTYRVSTDGLRIDILESEQSDANLLLGANDIQSAAYSIDNVVSGGFSTTESDKQKQYELYLESRLATDLIERFTVVKSAVVDLYIPENNGTLIAGNEESSAWILLELDGDFTTDNAAYLAKAIAKAIGNDTEENIVILDMDGNMLFSGDSDTSIGGTATSQLSAKSQAEKLVQTEVRQVLLGTNEFDKIEVASNLNMNFSSTNVTDHEYYVGDDQTQGYLSHEDIYSSDSTNGVSGVPGTDSNDGDTTYEYQDNEESNSSVTEESRDYLPSERITDTVTPAGSIDYGTSSVSVTAINYNVIRQEDAQTQGLLDGVTWEEYKLANAERTKLDVDQDMYDVVAKATGITSENIAIVAYSENVFFDREGMNIQASDVISIILIVVILGLLAFVVLRSMRTEKEAEQEEELSVEDLLQSQPEPELENIEMENMSETRRMIEKFVDDNPEAAASLLRNWLNEEWG